MEKKDNQIHVSKSLVDKLLTKKFMMSRFAWDAEVQFRVQKCTPLDASLGKTSRVKS